VSGRKKPQKTEKVGTSPKPLGSPCSLPLEVWYLLPLTPTLPHPPHSPEPHPTHIYSQQLGQQIQKCTLYPCPAPEGLRRRKEGSIRIGYRPSRWSVILRCKEIQAPPSLVLTPSGHYLKHLQCVLLQRQANTLLSWKQNISSILNGFLYGSQNLIKFLLVQGQLPERHVMVQRKLLNQRLQPLVKPILEGFQQVGGKVGREKEDPVMRIIIILDIYRTFGAF
jgi:hypothetical protein